MTDRHQSIIARAAKASLFPLGFIRKGQSRIWLKDYGAWVGVVEFQPSQWSKGSFLNVSAHWLWSPPNKKKEYVLSLDFGSRCREHVEFQDEEQFWQAMTEMAALAALESQRIAVVLQSVKSIADVLTSRELSLQNSGRGRHWGAFHAGMASALAGRFSEADAMFGAILETPVAPDSIMHPAAKRWRSLLGDAPLFRKEVLLDINRQRSFFKLPQLEAMPIGF